MCNNPKLDPANINAYINLVKIYQFVLKILSGNEIMMEGWKNERTNRMTDNQSLNNTPLFKVGL